MNLNKYHSSGRHYTPEESRYRAMKLFGQTFVSKGYKRETDRNLASPTYGQIIPETRLNPYTVGRNAAKRAAKARRVELWRMTK